MLAPILAHARPDPDALAALLLWLEGQDYHFQPPTPATHANRLAQPDLPPAERTEEILGWSRRFDPARAPRALVELLMAANVLETGGDGARSRIRVARVHGRLFLHSAWPTDAVDSVFLGPDSWRYADFVLRELAARPAAGICVDIGTGSGVAAILAALALAGADVFGTDCNPAALHLARINARHNGAAVTFLEGRGLAGVPGRVDLAMSNPPFMIDPDARLYRDGGGMHGLEVAHRIAGEVMARLAPGGRLLLFTGSPIVAARDPFCAALDTSATAAGCRLDYRLLDPDVYGEELLKPCYAGVDRIALVGAVVSRPRMTR